MALPIYNYQCSNNPEHKFEKPTGDFWCPLCDISTKPMLLPFLKKMETKDENKSFEIKKKEFVFEHKNDEPKSGHRESQKIEEIKPFHIVKIKPINMKGPTFKESEWKRFWSQIPGSTDLALRLFFPGLEKLRNVVSNDSMPALQVFFGGKVLRPKTFDIKNNEGYIKDSNNKLFSIAEMSLLLDYVISLETTYGSIEHLLPGELPTGVNFKDELRKHLGHIC
jgi:hypothetical protein